MLTWSFASQARVTWAPTVESDLPPGASGSQAGGVG